jgi:type IV pilus assembly protein PilA
LNKTKKAGYISHIVKKKIIFLGGNNMFKLMNKQRNKKGFTLIELIVVIAILGILALIAIPRFAGFTDRAKVGNDQQYGALLGNSVLVMLAAGDMTRSNTTDPVVLTVNSDGIVTAISGAGYKTGWTQANAISALEKMVVAKPLQFFKTTFSVSVAQNDTVTVSGTPTP